MAEDKKESKDASNLSISQDNPLVEASEAEADLINHHHHQQSDQQRSFDAPWTPQAADQGQPGSEGKAAEHVSSGHRKLFVGGLGWDTKRAELHDYFSQFGPLVQAEVMYNRDTGVPRGFGFVTFMNENDADAAMAKRHHQINHKTAEVKYAVKKGDDRLVTEAFNDKLQRQIFVGGLPRDATPDEVKDWAAKLFGEEKVVSAIVVRAWVRPREIVLRVCGLLWSLIMYAAQQQMHNDETTTSVSSVIIIIIMIQHARMSCHLLLLCLLQVLDLETKKPRGFGFVSFKSADMVNECLERVSSEGDILFREDDPSCFVQVVVP